MQRRIVYWKRHSYSESGFDLVEFFEDGQILKRRFERDKDNTTLYKETQNQVVTAKGQIVIEKVTFDQDGHLKKAELSKHTEALETYAPEDWQKARKKVRKLQEKVKDDLTTDYHSLLKLEENSIPEETLKLTDRTQFPIVKYRVRSDKETLMRKEAPEQVSVEFIPVLNEKLYFHYIPKTKHCNVSGTELFALETYDCKNNTTEEEFWDFMDSVLKKVHGNEEKYRALIDAQREQRAMHETDVLGDLYPR